MPKISAVIITLNEERNIERCICSLDGIVDEIIVVDSFSTDKTAEICKKHQVKFIQRQWEGYSATKNWANHQVSNPFILSLDADEALSDKLKNSIKTLYLDEKTAYAFNRLTNYCGKWIKHCGWYPDVKVRLFHKNLAVWEGDFVHEVLKLKPNTPVKHLEGDLYHYSFHTRQDHLNTIEKYATLHAQKLKAAGKKPSFIKEWINPVFKFIKTYFLQLGILDGSSGYHISYLSAKAVRLKYKKLRGLCQ